MPTEPISTEPAQPATDHRDDARKDGIGSAGNPGAATLLSALNSNLPDRILRSFQYGGVVILGVFFGMVAAAIFALLLGWVGLIC